MPRMASIALLFASSLAAAACSGPNTGTMDSGGSCPSGQHACACATGQYCVAAGAMCISPSSACPGTDGGVHDSGTITDGGDAQTDTGMATDAAHDTGTMDTGAVESGTSDTGTVDTGTTDAGTIIDTGILDTGIPDTGVLDTGIVDTGPILDTGLVDTGSVDTGNADTGAVDTGVPMCPPMQHVCFCATGYYCLRIGLACLAPGAPCPP